MRGDRELKLVTYGRGARRTDFDLDQTSALLELDDLSEYGHAGTERDLLAAVRQNHVSAETLDRVEALARSRRDGPARAPKL